MDIISVYDDVVKDTANADQNGQFGYEMFSRNSKRAELRLIDWLSGDIAADQRMPAPWVTQKNKDWLAPFIKKYSTQVNNGSITRPDDYYQFENFFRLGSNADADCEEDEELDVCNTPIEVLDGQQYNQRCITFIEELKVSLDKPIAKFVGKTLEVSPSDMGSVTLEYLRFPVFGSITSKVDPVYNEEIPDVVVDYEWDDRARPLLIWFIVQEFSINTRENALFQLNAASKP